MVKSQRLLLLTPGFAANEQDLNCIPPLQLLVQEFLKKGIEIHIVALEYPFSGQAYFWHGARVFPCNGQNRRWMKGRTLWRAMNYCHQILDSWQNQSPISNIQSPILSFWLGWASGVGERVAQRRCVRHFTTLMGQDVLQQNQKHLRGLTTERCERLVAVSDFQNQIFEKTTGFRAVQVIPWGVAEGEIPLSLVPERPLDVLGVGSLELVKNWGKWLRAIALAVKAFPDLQAELIGDGPERNRLETLARQLGIEKNIRFAGSLPRPEVLARMIEAKVLLHTADFESYGFVFAEAAMCGARIVSTPVGIAPEMGSRCAESVEGLASIVLESLAESFLPVTFVPYKMSGVAERYLELLGK